MSYLKDIEPYYDRIKLQQSGGGGIRNREIMLEIANIHFKYIHSKDFSTIADIGCRVCVTRMMNQLVGLYDTEVKAKGSKMTFPKIEPIEVEKEYNTIPKKWGAFKKYCTSKGLKVAGKTKTQLLKELEQC